jgi:N,N'-diacetyllegionaminate synthase
MTYVIAEAGVDHEGSMERALRLLDGATEAKADCFKIQYYAEGFRGAHRVLPWLSPSQVVMLNEACDEQGIDFLITPHDEWALEFITNELDMNRIKLGSNDWHLLDDVMLLGSDIELIISTGYLPYNSIVTTAEKLSKKGIRADILHCVPKYPCPANEARLWTIEGLKASVENAMKDPPGIGYSDHTKGSAIPLAAAVLGATVIEKHMTLERDIDGRNDTTCSLLPEEWPSFVQGIRDIEQAFAP